MRFYMPTDVYEEENCVVNHGADLAKLGNHALIVTGSHSAERNGSLHDVTRALATHGIQWTHFNEVEENPSVETVIRARDLGLSRGCDFVIGVGGGSPMDAAKAVALMMRHGEADESYLFDAHAKTDPLPIVCIPTTCGTGSEVTAVSVLTRPTLKKKSAIPHRIFANLALLDGKYLASAPRHVLANTTMDAFAHLAETFNNASHLNVRSGGLYLTYLVELAAVNVTVGEVIQQVIVGRDAQFLPEQLGPLGPHTVQVLYVGMTQVRHCCSTGIRQAPSPWDG